MSSSSKTLERITYFEASPILPPDEVHMIYDQWGQRKPITSRVEPIGHIALMPSEERLFEDQTVTLLDNKYGHVDTGQLITETTALREALGSVVRWDLKRSGLPDHDRNSNLCWLL